jgi:hypothetical protein
MGWYTQRLNNYRISYHDSEWDRVKDKQSKEYYENLYFNAEIKNVDTNEEIEIKIPFLELADIELLRKNYTYNHKEDHTLLNFLWKWIIEQAKESVIGVPVLRTYQYKNEFPDGECVYEYYLVTPIGSDNVMLSTKPKLHKINNLNDIDWLMKKSIDVDFNLKNYGFDKK